MPKNRCKSTLVKRLFLILKKIYETLFCSFSGITMMNKCLTMFALIAYSCAFVALVILIVSLGLVICARKQEAEKKTRKAKARGRWNKVLDVNIKSRLKKK